MSGTMTRILPDLAVRRCLPAEFGTYPSCVTACITLRRVAGATASGRDNTRDTVAIDTPARLATSKMLATRARVSLRARALQGRRHPDHRSRVLRPCR